MTVQIRVRMDLDGDGWANVAPFSPSEPINLLSAAPHYTYLDFRHIYTPNDEVSTDFGPLADLRKLTSEPYGLFYARNHISTSTSYGTPAGNCDVSWPVIHNGGKLSNLNSVIVAPVTDYLDLTSFSNHKGQAWVRLYSRNKTTEVLTPQAASLTIRAWAKKTGTAAVETATVVSLSATDDWQLIEWAYPNHAADPTLGFAVCFNFGDASPVPFENGATGWVFDITGMGVYQTTTPVVYNSGGDFIYHEDLTGRVIAADWQLGMSNFYDVVARDGTLRLTIDNQDQAFSPSNTTSDLYGALIPGLPVLVELYNPVTEAWQDMYQGVLKEINPLTGIHSAQTCELLFSQGLEELYAREVVYNPGSDADIVNAPLDNTCHVWREQATLIEELLTQNIQAPARLGEYWTMGVSALDVGTILGDPRIEIGDQPYSVSSNPRVYMSTRVGADWWFEGGSILNYLQKQLTVMPGWFYIARDGTLKVDWWLTYANLAAITPDSEVDLGVYATGSAYEYAPTYYNNISATYRYMRGYRAHVSALGYIDGQFHYNLGTLSENREGAWLLPANAQTTVDINSEDLRILDGAGAFPVLPAIMALPQKPYDLYPVIVPSSLNAYRTSTGIGLTAGERALLTGGIFYVDDHVEFRFTNGNAFEVGVTLFSYYAVNLVYFRPLETYSLTTPTNTLAGSGQNLEIDGEDIIHHIDFARWTVERHMAFRGKAVGEITEFSMYDRNDEHLDIMLNLAVGSVTSLSEDQTGIDEVPHMIFGESWNWTPTLVKADFKTYSMERQI